MIDVFDITSLRETGFPFFSWRECFAVGPAKQMAAESILQQGWTLFGFDFQNDVVVLLDVGATCDLSLVPFCYAEQASCASRLATVSFDDFISLSRGIKTNHKIVQLYNMGHCGSTLLHNVFNMVPDVLCLSEPKVFFDLAIARHEQDHTLLLELARAAMPFMSLLAHPRRSTVLVLKHFSQANSILPLMRQALPDACNLFLYRDAMSWANSYYGFAQHQVGVTMETLPEDRSFRWRAMSGNALPGELDGLVDMDAPSVTFDQLVAVCWALHIRDYQLAHAQGMDFLAVRYTELLQDRTANIAKILRYCGLDPGLSAATLTAFDTDSHQGTRTSHDKPVAKFNEENYGQVAKILAIPRINLDSEILLQGLE
jgi:hypothetical protein